MAKPGLRVGLTVPLGVGDVFVFYRNVPGFDRKGLSVGEMDRHLGIRRAADEIHILSGIRIEPHLAERIPRGHRTGVVIAGQTLLPGMKADGKDVADLVGGAVLAPGPDVEIGREKAWLIAVVVPPS